MGNTTGLPLAERMALATLRARLLDSAAACLDLADAIDAPHMDMEPDHEGEAEPAEASAQPATLAPSIRPAAQARGFVCPPPTSGRPPRSPSIPIPRPVPGNPPKPIRATPDEQRAAYRATGAQLPRNLRPGLLGSIGL